VAARDMHGKQVATADACGDPGGSAEQRLALGPARQRDDDSFTGLPLTRDAVFFAVALQVVLDSIGQPQQGEFPQCGQVARSEVVRQCGVDQVALVDVAVRHAPTQGFGGHVYQLDLFGRAHYRVGHCLPLHNAGDFLDDVVERLQVLDVHVADD